MSSDTNTNTDNTSTEDCTYPLWNSNYVKVWFCNFMIFFSFMLVMPLLPLYLSDQFGAGKHTIGVILSCYTVTALFARLFSGYIVDTYSRRAVLLISYSLFSFFFLGYIVGSTLLLFAIVRTLHGAPFGTVTVANSTVAIDVLHPSRRAEGIGYYGLSNNLATAVSPSIGLYIYENWGNYEVIFLLSLLFSACGVLIGSTVKMKDRPKAAPSQSAELSHGLLRFDRFFLPHALTLGIVLACLAFSYGVLATYLAIYSKEVMGMTGGTGVFFLVLSLGLMCSRLIGGRTLRKGRVVENASYGMLISVIGYLLFVAVPNYWGYFGCAVIVGLGNGHMYPAVQTMFVNLATHDRRGTANSSQLTSWDVGFGLGVILGGFAAELVSYEAAFWLSWIVNVCGVIFFFSYVRGKYFEYRLR